MPPPGMTEFLIERELGCGAFQVIEVIALYVVSVVPTYCTVQMMSFGSYNPGWKCLDNTTTHNQDNISTAAEADTDAKSELLRNNFTEGYKTQLSCQLFSECQRIEFDPSTSTIVTEWNLLCDQSWIPSTIISIQMAGILVGSLFSGQLADSLGRKKAFYGSLFFIAVLNFASAFSVSWRMFAACTFFLGVFCAGVLALYYVYPSEFLPRKWRAPLTGLPAWSLSGIFYGLITMALKDWRRFQVTVGAMTAFCFVSVVWIPESLRWLEVKNKDKEYKTAVEKMARLNKKAMPEIESATFIGQIESATPKVEGQKSFSNSTKKYTYVDLFHKGYRLYTVTLAAQWLSLNIVYVSITFGISILGGDFYMNLVIMNCLAVPCGKFPILVPNILGRKKSLLTCYFTIALALGIATILELTSSGTTKDTGIIIVIMLVVACIESARGLIVLVTTEIYPTVVRGLGVSWAKTVSRLGAIIAPVFIPTDSGAATYVWWYLTMVFLALACCVLAAFFLPETKGKPLKETFDEREEEESPQRTTPSSYDCDTDTETTRLL